MNTLMNILHVLTAVFIVGPMAILPMTGMRAMRSGDGRQVSTLARSTLIFTLLSLLTVIFGFGVTGTAQRDIPVTTPWILISLTLYVIAFILNIAVVWPVLRRSGRRLLEGDGETRVAASTSSGGVSDYTLVAMGSGIVSVLLLVVVILMVWKP